MQWMLTEAVKKPLVYWSVVAGVAALAVCLRCLVALQPYSGMGEAPTFGDFEAQRHWMELTVNLPVRQWYVNGTHNNLAYWGIDYPPLTAYFSWAWGKVAQVVVPEMVELDTSHGIETLRTKAFMRATAIVSDVLVYFTAAVAFARVCHRCNAPKQIKTIMLLLFQPALILVDHGHFQYNAVSLGLSLWAATCVLADHDVLGSVLFVLAINYKQMALYYAPAFFFFLLGKCLVDQPTWARALGKLVSLGAAVVATMALCWLPFLGSLEDAMHVVQRVFPVQRGLFEDKVANFWCAVSPLVKFRSLFDQSTLVKFSFAMTLSGFAPAVYPLFKSRARHVLLMGLAATAFAFYLFSYMVHEKTILFPLLPVTLLGVDFPSISLFTNTVAAFSMQPLLQREGLNLAYLTAVVAYATFCHAATEPRSTKTLGGLYLALAAYHVLEHVLVPPARYPDIFALLNACASFACFFGVHLVLTFRLVRAVVSVPVPATLRRLAERFRIKPKKD